MSNKTYGGKTASDWIAAIQRGNSSQKQQAMKALEEMLVYGYIQDQKTKYKVAKAAATSTHDSDAGTRHTAYGLVDLLARWLAFDLNKGSDREKQGAKTSLLMLVKESNNLPPDLVKVVPDVANAMAEGIATSKEGWDKLISKLKQEESSAKGKHRKEVAAARAYVEKVRNK